MSRSVNKIILVGNVGAEPELRTTPSGVKVAKFSLATNRTWTSNGTKHEKVEWHRVTAWDKLAEIIEKYVHKGDRLYVEGRVEYSQTEGDDGVTRYWTDVVLRELVMLGSSDAPKQERKGPVGAMAEQAGGGSPFDEDDDLPF